MLLLLKDRTVHQYDDDDDYNDDGSCGENEEILITIE
jgi:hypothetical protein